MTLSEFSPGCAKMAKYSTKRFYDIVGSSFAVSLALTVGGTCTNINNKIFHVLVSKY